MDNNTIIEGSKILAEYMGLKYIPFNDLQGLPKAGWWKIAPLKQGLSEYFQFNPKNDWVKVGDKRAKFVCRNHSQLRYFNDYNLLMEVAEKLEKEDLRQYFYKWRQEDEIRFNFENISVDRMGGWDVCIMLSLDPPMEISKSEKYKELCDRQQLFFCLVDAVEHVNNLRNEE